MRSRGTRWGASDAETSGRGGSKHLPPHGSTYTPFVRVELTIPPTSLLASLRSHRVGFQDPGVFSDTERYAVAFHTPSGPCALTLTPKSRTEIDVELEGSEHIESLLPAICGAADDPERLLPLTAHLPRLHSLVRRHRLVRMPAVPWRYEIAVGIVLQQRVDFDGAAASYATLLKRHGTRAPGRFGLMLLPTQEQLGQLPSHAFRALGIDGQRERALRSLLSSDAIEAPDAASARERLGRLSGFGPWTIESIAGLAYGDPDAVPTGDYWLPHLVSHALHGKARSSDEEMLSYLEPFRPQRMRLIRVLYGAGFSAQRFGPKRPRGPHEGLQR